MVLETGHGIELATLHYFNWKSPGSNLWVYCQQLPSTETALAFLEQARSLYGQFVLCQVHSPYPVESQSAPWHQHPRYARWSRNVRAMRSPTRAWNIKSSEKNVWKPWKNLPLLSMQVPRVERESRVFLPDIRTLKKLREYIPISGTLWYKYRIVTEGSLEVKLPTI